MKDELLRKFARLSVNRHLIGCLAILLLLAPLSAWADDANKIWLSSPNRLQVRFQGGDSATGSLNSAHGTPLALASDDFDMDGVRDLAAGYATPEGGRVAIFRGNLDAFAPQSESSFWAIARSEFPSPYLPDGQVIALPVQPDFLATGMFIGHDGPALIAAARGGNTIYVIARDSTGEFQVQQTLDVPGPITALSSYGLATGQYAQVVVGARGAGGPALLVYSGANDGLSLTAGSDLTADATAFAFGDLDGDGQPDVLIVAGGALSILHSGSGSVEPIPVPFTVTAAALGSFVFDRNSMLQMALLTDDGSVHILSHENLDSRPFSLEEMKTRRREKFEASRSPSSPSDLSSAAIAPAPGGWTEIERFDSVTASSGPLMFRTRISDHAADDILLLDGGRVLVIAHPDRQPDDTGAAFPAGIVLMQPEPYSAAIAALAERVNVDGRPGIILFSDGDFRPAFLMPLPDPTFTVNRTDDPTPHSPITTACLGVANDCSLREAILKSNATVGTDTVMVPNGTYTLTRARIANDFTGQQGTLEVTDSVNIVGGGQATTIIQGGTMSNFSDSVDKVFSFNEDIAVVSTATVSISSLTIQNGFNRGNVVIQDGWGGAFDSDTGTGTANITLTNVTLNHNKLNDGEGGGAAIFNTNNGSGTVTFTGCIIQDNAALRNPADGLHDANAAGNGGGLAVLHPATASLTTTVVQNNTATQVQGTGRGIGGGVWKLGGGNLNKLVQIHGGSITGNQSAGTGGGVLATSALTIDQGTVISNNTAGASGGGVWYNSGNAGTSASLTKVAITGNNASGAAGANTGVGGGMYVGTAGMPATISFSRFAGNLSQVAGANNLFNQNGSGGTAVTALNNWWGTDAASSTIFPSTPTCPTPGAQQVCFDPFIVLTHMGTAQKIRINQTSALTADMSKDNHGTAVGLANLDRIIGLPITFDGAVLGSLSGAGTTLNANAQATATFTAGATAGFGTANATVDQAVVPVNSNLIATATESGSTATITTAGAHGFSAGEFVKISGVGVSGYNSSPSTQLFKILSTTTTTFTYTANSSGLGNSSGGTANAGIIILQPPSMTKSFNPATVAKNTATTLTFTITNGNVVPIDASFTDTLPANLVVATTPSVSTTCGAIGTVTAAAGSSSIVYSNPFTSPATQPGNPTGTCTISVNVQSAIDNIYMNSVTLNSSDAGNALAAATASLTVINPPHIAKAFGAATIPLNGTTSLTFTIDSNTNQNLTLTGVAFTDTLPSGLVVATPGNPSTTCAGGTVTAADGSGTVSLSGASVAPSSSCTVSVTVKGTTSGLKSNSVQVTSGNGGTGNTAMASITVVAPPTISKAFNPSVSIPLNGISTLTFTINNPNTTAPGDLTGISFSDTLPNTTGTLVVAPTPNVVNNCNGAVTATAGTGVISLSGGTVAHNVSCTLSVDVKGTAAGDAANTTGNISSTEGGTGTTSNTATLKVVAPPTISKAFGAATIAVNGTTTVTFTITNPAVNTTAENGIAFSDTLTGGLQVAGTPGVSNTCGGSVTATANTTTISLSGGAIATPGNTCTVTVNVTGTQAGSVSNTTGAVSSTNGGTGAASNTANLTVVAPPTISKAFGAASIALNGTTTATFTITNPAANTTAENGIAFSDTLTGGLQVASTPGVSNTCGGSVTATANTTTISLSGGSIATPGNTCTVTVNVTGTQAGSKSNTTGAVSSTNGGTGAASNTANLTVVAPPTISKAFGAASIPLNGTTTAIFTITNPAANTTAENGIAFSDTLTSGLQVAGTPGVSNTCGGSVTATANTTTISLSGGAIATPGNTCTVTVNVTGTQAGSVSNTTGAVSSTNGGTGAASNTANLTVVAPPTISKAFGAASIPQNGTTTVTFTITNPAANTTAENGIAFSDTLTGGLQVASTPGVSNTCGGSVTAAANTTTISLAGGTIATPGNTCTITVNVTGTQAGNVSNTTGAVSSTNGGTGTTSNTANLTVNAGTGSLGGSIGLKSGPLNARVWPIIIGNGGSGTATSAQVTSFTLQQTSGTACTPVLTTMLPAVAGDIPPGGTAPANLTIDFTGCTGTVFFKATTNLSASGGAQTGTMVRLNQLP